MRVLFVEEHPWTADSAKSFFQVALARHGAGVIFRTMTTMPHRASGYDLVSLGEKVEGGLVSQLLKERPMLLQDLRKVPYLNVHANVGADIIRLYERNLPERTVHFMASDSLRAVNAMDGEWDFKELGLVRSGQVMSEPAIAVY